MGNNSPRKSKRLTEKHKFITPQHKKGREPQSRSDSAAKRNGTSSHDGSSTDDSGQKKSPETVPAPDFRRKHALETYHQMPSPASKRTPEKARLPAPQGLMSPWLNSPLMSPGPPLPLFQEPSPRKHPMSPTHQFAVNYNLNSPAGTPVGGDLAAYMMFETPGKSLPPGLSLSELFSSPSPQVHTKPQDRTAVDDIGLYWEDLPPKLPDSNDNLPQTLAAKDRDDMSAPWVGTLLVSPSTKDALAAVSLQQGPGVAPPPRIGNGTKRILDFNASMDDANAAAAAQGYPPQYITTVPPPQAPPTAPTSRLARTTTAASGELASPGTNSQLDSRQPTDAGPEDREEEDGSDDDRAEGVQALAAPEALQVHRTRTQDGTLQASTTTLTIPEHDAAADDQQVLSPTLAVAVNTAAALLSADGVLDRLRGQGQHSARETALTLLQQIAASVLPPQASKASPCPQPPPAAAIEQTLPEQHLAVIKTEPGQAGSPRPVPQQQQQQQARLIYHGKPSRLQLHSNESSTPRSIDHAPSSSAGEVHVSVIPPPTPDETVDAYGASKSCHCKKSQCLKLYCDCFAAGMYCSNCSCMNCQNSLDFLPVVMEKRNAIKQRNPEAFRQKITTQQDGTVAGPRHHKGCNCRKSHCLKKYCECFQNNVHCGDLCKCMDCENCDATYATRSRQRLGSRRQSQPGAWHLGPSHADAPITPYSGRHPGDAGASTPTSRDAPDLRVVFPASSQKISFPSTPVSNVQPASQAGTPPSTVRSASPATTPRSYHSQHPMSSQHTAHDNYSSQSIRSASKSNLAVSIVKMSRSPSPAQVRGQVVTANQVVANAPLPPQIAQPSHHQSTSSAPIPLPRAPSYDPTTSAPTGPSHKLHEQHSGSQNSLRTQADLPSNVHQLPSLLRMPQAQSASPSTASPGESMRGRAIPAAPLPPSASRMRSPAHLEQPMASPAPPLRQEAAQQQQQQQDGDDHGQMGMVIVMEDTETGEQYEYYMPADGTQLTPISQADGSVMLVPAQADNSQQGSPAAPAQLAAPGGQQPRQAGVQVLQLPDGQLMQISGLEPGQQLVVQHQGGDDSRQLVLTAATPGRGANAGRAVEVKQQLLSPTARQLPVGTRAGYQSVGRGEAAEMGYAKSARPAPVVKMEVDGHELRAEASGSQDENEVPNGDLPARHPPLAIPIIDPPPASVAGQHGRASTPSQEHRAHPTMHSFSTPPGLSPHARITSNKRKAADDSSPPLYQDAEDKILSAVQLPRGTAVRQLALAPPTHDRAHTAAAAATASPAQPPRTRSASGRTSDLLTEVARKVSAQREVQLERPVINVHGMGPVVTPTKLTLGGAAGLSMLSPGFRSMASPPGVTTRSSGHLFRISPGSTTIRPTPGSADKRHKVN